MILAQAPGSAKNKEGYTELCDSFDFAPPVEQSKSRCIFKASLHKIQNTLL